MTIVTTTRQHQAPKVPPWVNATMRWILRSPISRMVDRGIVLLTVTGRRTGTRFTFPVQYVQEGDVIWVMSSAGPEKTWWRNLVGGAPVQVLLRRHAFDGTAHVATYSTDPETVIQGVDRYMARFPRSEKKFGLADGDREAFDAFARGTVIVRIRILRELPASRRGGRLSLASKIAPRTLVARGNPPRSCHAASGLPSRAPDLLAAAILAADLQIPHVEVRGLPPPL